MRKKLLYVASILVAGLVSSCGGNQSNGTCNSSSSQAPELTRMKCEFVEDGGEATIYGRNLANAEIVFPGDLTAQILSANDTMVVVEVPEGTKTGRVRATNSNGKCLSKFFFRDDRNTIIDFDRRVATWGGYSPFEDDGSLIKGILDIGDSITPFPNGAKLPDPCQRAYGLLFGQYSSPWTMIQVTYIQYVANPAEGGRGAVSVAGKVFEKYEIEELALKFEVYIPEEIPYKGIRTEIFFGPIDAPDKHGRDYSPICHWTPYVGTEKGFYTDGWTTVTIPLTEFCHNTASDDPNPEYTYKDKLKNATNFSFLLFGKPEGDPTVLMCVDNFRIVPIEN